jgi:hypothetical protein
VQPLNLKPQMSRRFVAKFTSTKPDRPNIPSRISASGLRKGRSIAFCPQQPYATLENLIHANVRDAV